MFEWMNFSESVILIYTIKLLLIIERKIILFNRRLYIKNK